MNEFMGGINDSGRSCNIHQDDNFFLGPIINGMTHTCFNICLINFVLFIIEIISIICAIDAIQ